MTPYSQKEALDLLHRWNLARLKKEFPERADRIKSCLHEDQAKVASLLHLGEVKEAMLQCGRGWGKTELALYDASRFALTRAKAITYILLPQRVQGREIYWDSERLQNYIPPELRAPRGKYTRESQLRIRLWNRSSISINGSDNFAALRGVKPHRVIYDEFQDHDPRADIAMGPNLRVMRATLLRIGTPPEQEGYYTSVRDFIQKKIAQGDPRYLYMERPSWGNPLYDPEDLRDERERYRMREEDDIFEREYGAKFIPGGSSAVFPMYRRLRETILVPHEWLMSHIFANSSRLQWVAVCDPGQTCFAVLFAAVDPEEACVYLLDEIYERNRNETSAGRIYPRMMERMKELNPFLSDWSIVCDEAASWFMVDCFNRFQANIYSTKKASHDKKDDMSLIKDLMVDEGCLYISKKCVNLDKEVLNYILDKSGHYPSKNDHQIDNWRYLLRFTNFDPSGYSEPDDEEQIHDENLRSRKGASLQEIFDDFNRERYGDSHSEPFSDPYG